MDSVVFLLTLIHWIANYPADSVIQPTNNCAWKLLRVIDEQLWAMFEALHFHSN